MMHMLPLALAVVGAGIALAVAGLAGMRASHATERSAVRYLGEDGFVTTGNGGSSTSLLAALGRRLTGAGYRSRLAARLQRAGDTRTPEQVLVAKGAGAAAGIVLTALGTAASPGPGFLFGMLAGGVGFALPDVRLRRRADERALEIRRALPDALDLMAISVEAGVGLEGAMTRAAEDVAGPLGEELQVLLHEMQLGASRREAFQALKERVDVPEVSGFVLALLQADALGIAIGRVLKTQSIEMRRKRRQRAREQAAKTPVKILFPLIFGIFPALLIVVMGPAAIRIIQTLGA